MATTRNNDSGDDGTFLLPPLTTDPDNEFNFSTGACKLHRLGASSSPHVYVMLSDTCIPSSTTARCDYSFIHRAGDEALELFPDDITCRKENSERCFWNGTTNYQQYPLLARTTHEVFSAFNLTLDSTGRSWQLRYVVTPDPAATVESLAYITTPDIVLGMLPGGTSRAGLVPRFIEDDGIKSPTPYSQITVRREECDAFTGVSLENARGFLTFDPEQRAFFWRSRREVPATQFREFSCFEFHRLLDVYNLDVVEPLPFIRSKEQPAILVVPPSGVLPDDYDDDDTATTTTPSSGNDNGGGNNRGNGGGEGDTSLRSKPFCEKYEFICWLIFVLVLLLIAAIIALIVTQQRRKRGRKSGGGGGMEMMEEEKKSSTAKSPKKKKGATTLKSKLLTKLRKRRRRG